MIIGHMIGGRDNGTHMYQGDAAPPRCAGCGFVRQPTWVDPGFRLRDGRLYDVSVTYDGRLLVSDNFRVATKNLAGTCFVPLPSEPGWHLLLWEDVVSFDAVRRRTRFGDICMVCKKAVSVAGAHPVFLTGSHALPEGVLFRTDVEFGSGDELSPLPLVGPATGSDLARHRLRGLEIVPVEV